MPTSGEGTEAVFQGLLGLGLRPGTERFPLISQRKSKLVGEERPRASQWLPGPRGFPGPGASGGLMENHQGAEFCFL